MGDRAGEALLLSSWDQVTTLPAATCLLWKSTPLLSSITWLLRLDPESVQSTSAYGFILLLLLVLLAVWPSHHRPNHADHRCFSMLLAVTLASPVCCLCQMVLSQFAVFRTAPSTLPSTTWHTDLLPPFYLQLFNQHCFYKALFLLQYTSPG